MSHDFPASSKTSLRLHFRKLTTTKIIVVFSSFDLTRNGSAACSVKPIRTTKSEHWRPHAVHSRVRKGSDCYSGAWGCRRVAVLVVG